VTVTVTVKGKETALRMEIDTVNKRNGYEYGILNLEEMTRARSSWCGGKESKNCSTVEERYLTRWLFVWYLSFSLVIKMEQYSITVLTHRLIGLNSRMYNYNLRYND
jgi:hypothetical protein